MKNQNPQDILNEILLRMNYDSKKTLSENTQIIFEQSGTNPPYKRNETNRQRQDIYNSYSNSLRNIYQQIIDLGRLPNSEQSNNFQKYDNLWKQWKQLTSYLVYDKDLQEDEDVIKKVINRNFAISGNSVTNQKLISQPSGYYYLPNGKLSFSMTKINNGLTLQNYISSKGLVKNKQGFYSVPSIIPSNEQLNLLSLQNSGELINKQISNQNNFKIKDPTNDVEETKNFQDWLDFYYPTWYKGATLNKGDGYGVFGPKTSAAWSKYKTDYQFNGFKKGLNDIFKSYDVANENDARVQPWPSEEYDKFIKEVNDFKDKFRTHFGPEVFKIYFPKDERRYQEKQMEEYSQFLESEYKQEKNKIDKYCQIQTPYNTGLGGEELNNYVKTYNQRKLECNKLYKDLELKYQKTKFSTENLIEIEDNIEIPKNSKLTNYSQYDFKDVKSIKEAFVTNILDEDLSSFTAPPNFVPSSQTQIKSPNSVQYLKPNFKWIWSLVEGEIKSIVLEPPYDNVTWKRFLWYDTSKNEYKLKDGFWFKNEFGDYVEYNKNFLWDSTFFERNKSFILGLASMIIAMAGPQTWPILAASAAFDLVSSYDDIKNKNYVGGAVGLIFAAIPFISKALITHPMSKINSVVSKFKNVKTTEQFNQVYVGLKNEEKRIFRDAFEIDKEKLNAAIKNASANPDILKNAIKITPKIKDPSLGLSTKLKRNLSELGIMGSTMILSSPIKDTQNFIGQKKEVLLKYIFDKTLFGKVMDTYNEQIGKSTSDAISNGYSSSDESEIVSEDNENKRLLSNQQIKDENDELLESFDVNVGIDMINNIVNDPSDTVTKNMMDTLNASFPKLIKK